MLLPILGLLIFTLLKMVSTKEKQSHLSSGESTMIPLFHTSLHIFQATHYLPLGKLASSTPLLITSAPLSLFLPTWTILYGSPNPNHNLKKLLTLLPPSIPWLIFKSTLPNLYLLPNKAQPTSHFSTPPFSPSHPATLQIPGLLVYP